MPADPGISVHIVETRTGNIAINELPYVDTPRFLRQLNNDCNITVTVPVGDLGVPAADRLKALVSPWRFSLAVCMGTAILAYGPIMTYQFQQDSMLLTIGAGSIWALLGRKWAVSPTITLASPLSMDAAQDLNYTSLTLASIARGLVADTVGRGSGHELPIDFPASVAGTNLRNYPVYDLANIGQRLKDITQVENGPDIDWDPYFNTSSNIRIGMRIGNPTLTQVGQALIWDSQSSIKHVDVDSNASGMATAVLTRGNATERASQVAWANDTSLVTVGWPVLETVDTSHQSVTDFSTLQGYANEWIRFYKNPVVGWKADIVATASPVVGTYKPGDLATFNMQGHPWIPNGTYSQRILGWSDAGPSSLTLVLESRTETL